MATTFQTLQRIDGEWVSTNVDIYQFLDRARRQDDAEMHEPQQKPQPSIPCLGVLSKTVFPSPYIKFILPANLRQSKVNDVVFVSESAVHLKEVRAKGPLRHIASKTDIDGRILSARVFGKPRKIVSKSEHGTPIKRRDVHAQRRSTASEEADVLPSEILVLTTDKRALLFLWATQAPSAKVKLCQKAVRLPYANSRFDRIGSFLAIDPLCRAIAVSATEGQFILYKTKTLEQWREDIRAGHDAPPIEDERIIPIEGRVMHMEFLSPGPDPDDPNVMLLFVLAIQGKVKITLYEWDVRNDIGTAAARVARVSADFDDHNPSLLVPLSRSPDFLLIHDRHISICRDILSGTIQRTRTNLDDRQFPPTFRPGEGTSLPHWVQWQRPARNEEFNMEALYVAREDGLIMYAQVSHDNKMPMINDACKLPHSIDRAFANLDVDHGPLSRAQPDILVAAGTTSDGSLTKIGSWVTEGINQTYQQSNASSVIEYIPNWAPTSDLCVSQLKGTQQPSERERNSIFIADGRGLGGRISELRLGIRAHIRNWCAGMKGCSGVFILGASNEDPAKNSRQADQYEVIILANIAPETLVFRLCRREHEWEMEQISEDAQDKRDEISRDETVAAGIISERFAAQITHTEAKILSRQGYSSLQSQPIPGTILAATVNGTTNSLAIVCRAQGAITLAVFPVLAEGNFGAATTRQLTDEPTCLEIMTIDRSPHVFVGYTDASIQILEVTHPTMEEVFTLNLNTVNGEVARPAESAVLLHSASQSALVCGTRDGKLVRLTLNDSTMGFGVSTIEHINMGTTSVKVTPCATDPSVAFAACGTDLCRLSLGRNINAALKVDSLWFTDAEDSSYQQSPISALTQLPLTDHDEDADMGLAGFLFAISGDRLLIGQIDYDIAGSRRSIPDATKTIPRTFQVDATPTKLMYSENLRKKVIAITDTKQERSPPNAYRSVRSAIKLLDFSRDEVEVKREDEMQIDGQTGTIAEFELRHYERVHCMLEWVYTDSKGRSHHFIFVGTGLPDSSGMETKGRKLFFQIDSKTSSLKLKKEKEYNGPVRGMSLDGPVTLVTVVGKSMYLEQYDYQLSKWQKHSRVELLSDAVHVTASNSRIYVSTSKHSHFVYQKNVELPSGMGHVPKPNLEKLFSDHRQRPCAHHLVLSADTIKEQLQIPPMSKDSQTEQGGVSTSASLVLISDKNCTLSGLYCPDQPLHQTAAPTIFEAHLPRTITRLAKGDIRPPWRRSATGSSPPGVIVDDVIGSCSDGTIYSLAILSDSALRILKFVQNLIELKEHRSPTKQFSIIQHGTPAIQSMLVNGTDGDQASSSASKAPLIKAMDIDLVGEKSAPQFRYVDADVINRFFDDDVYAREAEEEDSLWELLTKGTDKDVLARFLELAGNLELRAETGDREDMVDAAAKWMRDVLMGLL